MTPLYLAYGINLAVLVPIAIPTLLSLFATDQERFEESAGWRMLVGSLWFAILVLSVLGLLQPLRYSPVLLLQLIYKSVWLAFYAVPRLLRGEVQAVPWGIAGSFALIVLAWPCVIPWDYLFPGSG
jgi:hypothetical protein